MSIRVVVGQFLVRLGRVIQSLAVMVMKPADLVEFSRLTYAKKTSVEGWGSDEFIDSGLDKDENALLEKMPVWNGRLLLLGAGGGREAIPLSQMGYEITVLDFVPEMVQKAEENARKRGLYFQGVVQEISTLDMPADSFDSSESGIQSTRVYGLGEARNPSIDASYCFANTDRYSR